jgi:hypothetical protein
MRQDMLDRPLIKALLVVVVGLLQVDVAVVQLEVVAVLVPEVAVVQPSAVVVESVLVGAVQVVVILLFTLHREDVDDVQGHDALVRLVISVHVNYCHV